MPGLPLFAGLRLRVLSWKEQELGKDPQRAQITERRGDATASFGGHSSSFGVLG